MANIVLRDGLGRLLTKAEGDANFENLNDELAQAESRFYGDVDPSTINGVTVGAGFEWAHEAEGVLKRRNDANDGWVVVSPLFEELATKSEVDNHEDRITNEEIETIRQRILSQATLRLDFAQNKYRLYEGIASGQADKPFADVLTFTRNSAATGQGATGLIETVGVDEPRLVWKDGKPVGLLNEEQRTNLLTWSEDFSNAVWNKQNTTVDLVSAPSPVSSSYFKLVEPSGSGTGAKALYQITPTSGLDYSITFIAKSAGDARYAPVFGGGMGAAGEIPVFDLDNGILIEPAAKTVYKKGSIAHIGDGWYVCAVSLVASSTGLLGPIISTSSNTSSTAAHSYLGDGTSGYYIAAIMIEQAPTPSSYIKTEASQVTRSGDLALFSPSGSKWQGLEGTFYLKVNDCLNADLVKDPVGDNPLLTNVSGSGDIIITYRADNSGEVWVDGVLAYDYTPYHNIDFHSMTDMIFGSGMFVLEKSFHYPRVLSELEIAQIQGAF